MLYIFHVDIGTMLTFDMSLAMQSVINLQEAISKRCHIPRDKQVLLISGGDNLDPSARVCSYSAGTDSNPIFLFSKLSIESANPPSMTGNYINDNGLLVQLESSLRLPPNFETIGLRAQLALQLRDVARDIFVSCQHLVHDQHLQHQGWAAVTANLDDISSAFRSRSEVFMKSFEDYLSTRDKSLAVLSEFDSVAQLLDAIPLLPCLSALSVSDAKTLLDWINAQDKRNTLEQMVQQCQTGLAQYDSKLNESLASEINVMLSTLGNPNMIEVKGVEERLSRLEQMMIKAKDSYDDIVNSTQSLVQNQSRARTLQDMTVIPDLCMKHQELLTNMSAKFQLLQDLQRRINLAKDELSANLHTRLRWVMIVEKSICDIDSKLIIRHETLKKIRHRIEVLRQIHAAPAIYCRALVEVVRRKQFSSKFVQWADSAYGKYSLIHSREKEIRCQFEECIGKHFLKSLFPGFDDVLPSFMSKLTTEFDNRLPNITSTDIEYVQNYVPQLSNDLRISTEDFTLVLLNEVAVPVPCDLSSNSVDIRCDVSSQSVEIISHEESQLLKESLAASRCADVSSLSTFGSRSNERASEAFVTADFYIGESLPPSPATDAAAHRKIAELSSALQEKVSHMELIRQQLSELQTLNSSLENKLSENVVLDKKFCDFVTDLRSIVSPGTDSDPAEVEESSRLLLACVQSAVNRRLELESQLEQERSDLVNLNNEFDQAKQEMESKLQQLEIDFVNKCQEIEKSMTAEKKVLEDDLKVLRELLSSKELEIKNFESEKVLLAKEFDDQLNLQRTEVEKEASVKWSAQVTELEDRLNCILEERKEAVSKLKSCLEKNQDEAKLRLEEAELERRQSEIEKTELNTKLNAAQADSSRLLDKLHSILDTVNHLYRQLMPDVTHADQETESIPAILTDFVDKLCSQQQEKHNQCINSLNEQYQLELKQLHEEIEQLNKSHEQIVDGLKEQHAEKIDLLEKHRDQISEDLEQEKRLQSQSVEQVKEHYLKIIEDLNEKLSAEHCGDGDNLNLSLVLDDYLPMRRHEEAVDAMKNELKLADERKTMELKLLEAQHELKLSELRMELVMKHDQEMHQLKTQHQLEMFALKNEQARPDLAVNQMTESVMPAPFSASALFKSVLYNAETKPKEVLDKELRKLEDKLTELSFSEGDRKQVMQRTTLGSCKEGDIVLFTWEEPHRHYVAFLPEECPKHFLHSDCLESLGLSPEGFSMFESTASAESLRKSIILQITSKEYCLAKKANNRFRVPLNTKFFRVKAKPCTFVTSQSSYVTN